MTRLRNPLRNIHPHRSLHHQAIRDKTIHRYLQQYAEPICQQISLPGKSLGEQFLGEQPCPTAANLLTTYDHVLVIPAFDEPIGCLAQVLSSPLRRTLVIVVVNAAEDSDRAAIERTQHFWNSFQEGDSDRALGRKTEKIPGQTPEKTILDSSTSTTKRYRIIPYSADTTVLVVDCCTEGHQLPPNQGVGLARKIGGDIALSYMAQEIVASDWIHYTDADVVLPDDFFQMDLATPSGIAAESQINPDNIAAVLYPFRHQPPHRHILLYELSLRYYVTELAAARSPYAFHTIGSLMCVNGLHYAKVRGFPKRKAAEDFYMLNKLAKTGAIVQLQSPIVQLDSRLSHRVPFGTGAMMTKLAQSDEFLFYHPAIFQHLREWMECIEALWPPIQEPSPSPQSSIITDPNEMVSEADHPVKNSHDWIKPWFSESQWQGACWLDCLVDMGLGKTLQQAYRQSRDRYHFRLYLWTWFDAFRTLKFVHYLRDYHYPSLTVEAWVKVIQAKNMQTERQQNLGWVADANPKDVDETMLAQINQYFCDVETTQVTMGPTMSAFPDGHQKY